jgi:hypothetical protein
MVRESATEPTITGRVRTPVKLNASSEASPTPSEREWRSGTTLNFRIVDNRAAIEWQ